MNKAGKCGEKFNTSQANLFLCFMSHWQRITEPAQEHGCAARSSVLKKVIFAAEEKKQITFLKLIRISGASKAGFNSSD